MATEKRKKIVTCEIWRDLWKDGRDLWKDGRDLWKDGRNCWLLLQATQTTVENQQTSTGKFPMGHTTVNCTKTMMISYTKTDIIKYIININTSTTKCMVRSYSYSYYGLLINI